MRCLISSSAATTVAAVAIVVVKETRNADDLNVSQCLEALAFNICHHHLCCYLAYSPLDLGFYPVAC